MFIRNSAENNTQVAPNVKAKIFPFNSSIDFHTIKIVKAPYKAGKNLTQKNELPNNWIMYDVQEVKGGTERYPQAKWFAWSRCKNSSRCKSYSLLIKKKWNKNFSPMKPIKNTVFFFIKGCK